MKLQKLFQKLALTTALISSSFAMSDADKCDLFFRARDIPAFFDNGYEFSSLGEYRERIERHRMTIAFGASFELYGEKLNNGNDAEISSYHLMEGGYGMRRYYADIQNWAKAKASESLTAYLATSDFEKAQRLI
jgi:hypothetical protein